MLPSERLELAIYKHVSALHPPVHVSLPQLSQIVSESDHRNIVERLKDLEINNRVLLTKYSGGQRLPPASFPSEAAFYYRDSFLIEIAPQGRKYFEELEQRAENESKKSAVPSGEPLIFVSCGQSTPEERELGQQIAKLVENETSCRAYFAENQNTLEGITENILKRLRIAAGFIAIMHPRGNVTNPRNTSGQSWVRGSVWVEQEIAIAAFISQALERPMRVRAYVHESILREGLRDKLHLNPKLFKDDSEILDDLAAELPSWRNLDVPQQGQFNLEHSRLAKEKLERLSETSKNLVVYLLHHGKTEATELMKKCRPQEQFNEAIQQARGEGLVKDSVSGNPARPSTLYFWEVTPSFEAVLREQLGA
jgi:hypothetical protein